MTLPARFELKVDVLCYSSELAQIFISGHPLGYPTLSSMAPDRDGRFPGEQETWHDVRLARENQLLSLWVDGQRIPIASLPGNFGEALTIEPSPKRPITFRNLDVTW
jgi:hypothetical protein